MDYSAKEMMTVAAARALTSEDVCFVGIGAPSAACNLARLTHAPGVTLIYESGTIGTEPNVLPLSIGDGELCETALTTVSVPEMFRYWLQGGRITIGFLGGAQMDRFGNLNTTIVGDYHSPKVRLPGGGGAPEIAVHAQQIYITMKQSPRGFVPRIDFFTSFGFGEGGEDRARRGIHVALVAGTASGKTLAYQIPIAERALSDPKSTALLLYPTKALARDQLRSFGELGLDQVVAAVYDGATDHDHQRNAHDQANQNALD